MELLATADEAVQATVKTNLDGLSKSRSAIQSRREGRRASFKDLKLEDVADDSPREDKKAEEKALPEQKAEELLKVKDNNDPLLKTTEFQAQSIAYSPYSSLAQQSGPQDTSPTNLVSNTSPSNIDRTLEMSATAGTRESDATSWMFRYEKQREESARVETSTRLVDQAAEKPSLQPAEQKSYSSAQAEQTRGEAHTQSQRQERASQEASQQEAARVALRQHNERIDAEKLVAQKAVVDRIANSERKETSKESEQSKAARPENEVTASTAIVEKRVERSERPEPAIRTERDGPTVRENTARESTTRTEQRNPLRHEPSQRIDRPTPPPAPRVNQPSQSALRSAPQNSQKMTLLRTNLGRSGSTAVRSARENQIQRNRPERTQRWAAREMALRLRERAAEIRATRSNAELQASRARSAAQAREVSRQALQLQRAHSPSQVATRRMNAPAITKTAPDQSQLLRNRLVSRLGSIQEVRQKAFAAIALLRKYSPLERAQRLQQKNGLEDRSSRREKIATKREALSQKLDKKELKERASHPERNKELGRTRKHETRPQEQRKAVQKNEPREARTVESRRLSAQRQQHLMRLKLLSEVTRHIMREVSRVADLQTKAKMMKSLLELFNEERSLASAERLHKLSDLLVALQKRRGADSDPRIQRLLRRVRALQAGEAGAAQGPALESSTSKAPGGARATGAKAAPSKHITNEGPKTSLDIYQARIDDKKRRPSSEA